MIIPHFWAILVREDRNREELIMRIGFIGLGIMGKPMAKTF